MDYFFQNIFGGLATIFTGLIAWIIYLYHKRDRKIEAATILLTDMISAEREIDVVKKNKDINNFTSIIKFNHWDQLQHLFVKNFDQNDFNSITDFFHSCILAEESIKMIKSNLPIAMDEKCKATQRKLLELADKEDYENVKAKILRTFEKEDYWFVPAKPKIDLLEYINNTKNISTSNIGKIFKDIKESKWYRVRLNYK